MKGTSAGRVIALTAFLVLAFSVYFAQPLFKTRPTIPPLAGLVDEPEEFLLTAQFATRNDREVLVAVLEGVCEQRKLHFILSDQPIERADNRKQLGLDQFPAGITCESVGIESSEKLDNAISTCPKSAKPALPSTSSWPCFNYHYPRANGILTLSLPFYYQDKGIVASVDYGVSCGWLCGSGRKYLLRKIDGQWKVIESGSTWIA